MGKPDKKRRPFVTDELPKSVSASKLSSAKGQGKESNRRISVLNKLFMKNITDLMATETFANDVLGYGIQVSQVKVSPDFHGVNVYWLAKGDENDYEIEKILSKLSGALRHELSQLKVMGEVPKIHFVKDKKFSKAFEVDTLLKKADFGEDFVPTDPTLFMKSVPELEMKIPEEIKAKIKELESSMEDDFYEEPLPEMRHDVLGLNHYEIMKKITKSIDKQKIAWDQFQNRVETSESLPTVESEALSIEKLNKDAELQENFVKFLEKRTLYKKQSPERKKPLHLRDDSTELEESWEIEMRKRYEQEEDFIEEDSDNKK